MEGLAMISPEQQIVKCEKIIKKYGLEQKIGEFRNDLARMGYLIAMVDGELEKSELLTINNKQTIPTKNIFIFFFIL